jgi:6-phosphogluconolactonase
MPTQDDAATPPTGDGGFPRGAPDAASPPIAADATAPPDALDEGTSTPTDGGTGTDAATHTGTLVLYASGYGPNIDRFTLDTARGLSTPQSTTAFSNNPSFLAVNRAATHLYAVDEDAPGQVGAYSMDPNTGALTFQNAVSSGGDGPPFLGLDRSEAFLLVANYDSGHVAVVPVNADGSLSAPTSTQVAGKNAHMILTDPSNRFAFVPCLGSDYVAQYVFDATKGTLTANDPPTLKTATGAGPRHMAFHQNGKFVYLVNESDSTMTALSFDATSGTLTPIQTRSMLPPGFSGTNTAAEVWVHPSGALVLGSNRGDDSIVAFSIDQATGKMSSPVFTKSGGVSPRDFTFDPTGSFVFVANEGNTSAPGNVAAFQFDATTAALTAVGSPVALTNASFVEVVRLPN